MQTPDPLFELRLAAGAADLRAAQRLRYAVFVAELGGDGAMVDHDARLEIDGFDAHCDHLLLRDLRRPAEDQVVGVYRLLRSDQAACAGQFYSETEFDLSRLRSSGGRLLELGRSCLHPAYRGGMAMVHLWSGLARYVADHGIDVLFGVASFPGRDPAPLAQPLTLLHHRHLAPEHLRPVARSPGALTLDRVPLAALDRKAAVRAMPSLIKAYLRLGGGVGAGAFRDEGFNCIDVCLVLEAARMSPRQVAIYGAARRGQG